MDILYEINGVKYVLIEIPVVTSKSARKLTALVKKYNCIDQSAKVDRGLFTTIIYARVLVPEKSIIEFNNESSQ